MELEPLKKYQITTIEHIKATPVCFVGNSAGLGKTRCEIESWKDTDRILYICPAHLIPNVEKEIKKWRPAIHKNVKTASFTFFSRVKDKLVLPKFDRVVIDECTNIKNPEAKCTMVILYKVLPLTEKVTFISASPIQKSALDIYPIISKAFPKLWGDPNEFGQHFCNTVYNPYSGKVTYEGVKLDNLSELKALFDKIKIKFLKADVAAELPPIIEDTVYLDPLEIPDYDPAELDLAHLTKEMKSEYQKLGMEKIPYLLDAIESNPDEPTLIGVHHRAVNEEYYKALTNAGKRVAQIMGGSDASEKQMAVDMFQDSKLDYLVISLEAGSTGLNLPRASRVMLGELPMTYTTYYQFVNRAHRLTTKQSVYVQKFCLTGTMDEAILRIMDTKENNSDQVVGKIDNVIKKDKTNGTTKKSSRGSTATIPTATPAIPDTHTRDIPDAGGTGSISKNAKGSKSRQSTGPKAKRGRPAKGNSDRDNSGSGNSGGTSGTGTRPISNNASTGEGRRYSLTADDLCLSIVGKDDLGLGLPIPNSSTNREAWNTLGGLTVYETKCAVRLPVGESKSGTTVVTATTIEKHYDNVTRDDWFTAAFG